MVYLLHYASRLHHAQHDLGFSQDVRDDHQQRIRKHDGTSGAHLPGALRDLLVLGRSGRNRVRRCKLKTVERRFRRSSYFAISGYSFCWLWLAT
jgi:hypothetical protein